MKHAGRPPEKSDTARGAPIHARFTGLRSSAAPVASGIATIQTAAGNLAIQRKCACGGSSGAYAACAEEECPGPQTKLTVNEPGDAYEQEADSFADQVMASSAPSRIEGSPRRLAHAPGRAIAQTGDASSVDQALASPGNPLEPALRQDMEQRFGQDFSAVRVHADATAAESAHAVNARAYTVGDDIVFSRGHYSPETSSGKRLLAHELTHVVQQSGVGGSASATNLQRDSTDDLADYIARDLDNQVASNPSPYGYILDAFRKISSDIEDNVAAAFTRLQSSAALERFAKTPDGLAVLNVLTEAMITGSVSLFESQQAERILVAKRQSLSTEQFTAEAEKIAALRHRASPAVSEDLLFSQMATDLNVYLTAGHYAEVTSAFDDIPSDIEDNVAAALMEWQSGAKLETIAADPAGGVMLDALYEAMITGHVTAFESLQSEKILIARANARTHEQYAASAERIAGLRDKAEDSPEELILDRLALATARALSADAAGGRYKDVTKSIRDLSAGFEDNVASHFIELQPPVKLEEFAADNGGRAMLDVLYEAIITGDVSDFERLQADRILGAKTKKKTVADIDQYLKTLEGERQYILPLRMQTTFRSNYAIFKATLQPNGNVKVIYDDVIHFWSSDMFAEDRKNLPGYGVASVGFELGPDELVWLKLYDQGKTIIPVPALALIDYANQAKRKSVSVGVSAFEMGLFMGYGGLAAFSGEGVGALAARVEAGQASIGALRIAQGVLWADRVAMALPLISLVVNENRDWILEKFPTAGPVLLGALDQANRIAGYYGWARMGFDAARYLKSQLEPALAKWRAEKAAAGNLTSSQRSAIDEIEANIETIKTDLAKTETEAANEAVQYVEAHPDPAEARRPPGERHAKVGDHHEVLEVKDPVTGAIHCEFHSNGGSEVPCPKPWTEGQTQAEPTAPTEPVKTEEPATPGAPGLPPVADNAARLQQVTEEIAQNTQTMRQVQDKIDAARARWKEASADATRAQGADHQRLIDKAERNRRSMSDGERDIEALRRKNNALRDEEARLTPPPAAQGSKPERGQTRPRLPTGSSAPREPISVFGEPFRNSQMLQEQASILSNAKQNPQAAGRQYENLVVRDFAGGTSAQGIIKREGRVMDIGTGHEVTIEGLEAGMGSGKLDQLWDDLADNGTVLLTVPKLSAEAADQLERMLAQARQELGPNVQIIVRTTLP